VYSQYIGGEGFIDKTPSINFLKMAIAEMGKEYKKAREEINAMGEVTWTGIWTSGGDKQMRWSVFSFSKMRAYVAPKA
jgi:hypothetical protein